MTGIDQGLELVRRSAEDRDKVPAAQQILRNWRHRLDRLTVLDGASRLQVQKEIQLVLDWLGRVHRDPVLFANRHADAQRQIDSLRRGLIALVGDHGLD